MNSNEYLKILGDHVQPAMDFCFPNGNGIFQDDNTRVSSARKVENWFEEFNRSFQHMYRLPQSSDLNPIEKLWDELERKLRGLSQLSRTLPDLVEKLLHLWTKIDHHGLKKVVDLMPSRMKAVTKAKGGPIHHQ